MTAIITLMRRAGEPSPQEQLELVYENMDLDTQMFIPLSNVTSLAELSSRVTDFEAARRRKRERRPEPPASAKPVVATAYNREQCCWRCKQRGHTRQHCQRPPKKFCSRCGKDGVLTRDCHPPARNGSQTGGTAATSRDDSA